MLRFAYKIFYHGINLKFYNLTRFQLNKLLNCIKNDAFFDFFKNISKIKLIGDPKKNQ